MPQTDRYAVFGCPIGHSLSPTIHQQFAKQTQQNLSYQAMEVNADAFEKEVNGFFSEGGKGINCTVPLKELAFKRADKLSERARYTGAVNTLKLEADGSLYGDNTDGVGLKTDLCDYLKLSFGDKRILVLGAGGATRGILGPLLELNPSKLWVANRTLSKAKLLGEEFVTLGQVSAVAYSELLGQQFDLVINATSASLSGELPPLPTELLAKDAVCYDLAYAKTATTFVQWGQERGARLSIDGLGMLVEQAAHAFYLWRGVMPKTDEVRGKIRAI